jgi:hypothetical protein
MRPLVVLLALLGLVHSTAPVPVAPPVVVFAGRGEEVVIRLPGYSSSGRAMTTTILSTPTSFTSAAGAGAPSPASATSAGQLHELSQLFVTQGLQPRRGRALAAPQPVPQAHGNRVLFVGPPSPPPPGAWGTFTYRVADGAHASGTGVVFVIPPHKRLAYSDFRADTDGWRVATGGSSAPSSSLSAGGGAGAASAPATLSREAFSRGLLSQYLVGTDARVASTGMRSAALTPTAGGALGGSSASGGGAAGRGTPGRGDASLWYFVAPSHFLGNKVAAYGGSLTFVAGSLAGDFSNPSALTSHAGAAPLITLECNGCAGGLGIRLGYFPSDAASLLDGKTKKFSIPLTASAWLRDPRNSLARWAPVSDCEFVRVLEGLSGLAILGDWTSWYETVAIDDVALMVQQPWPGIPKACYPGG